MKTFLEFLNNEASSLEELRASTPSQPVKIPAEKLASMQPQSANPKHNTEHVPAFHSAIMSHSGWTHKSNLISRPDAHLGRHPVARTSEIAPGKEIPKAAHKVGGVYTHPKHGKMQVDHLGWSHTGSDGNGVDHGSVKNGVQHLHNYLKKLD